ncbi:Unknown protein, partial [Striga hermonthica]
AIPVLPDYNVLFQNPEFVKGFTTLMAHTIPGASQANPVQPSKSNQPVRPQGGVAQSHATSHPRQDIHQPQKEGPVIQTNAPFQADVIPPEAHLHEQTAESHSARLQENLVNPITVLLLSQPARRTDLRQRIEQNLLARHESLELGMLRRKVADLETRQRASDAHGRRDSTSAHVDVETDSPLASELTSEPLLGKERAMTVLETDIKKKDKKFAGGRFGKPQFKGLTREGPTDPEVRMAKRQYAEDLRPGYHTIYYVGAATIFEELKGKGIIPDPRPIRTPEDQVDKSKYCGYHKYPGHNTDEYANRFVHPHSDALIVTALIGDIPVHRILIDTGAYSSILMYQAFEKIGMDPTKIKPCDDRIQGFNGSVARPIGEITLPVRFETPGSVSKVTMETFKIMDIKNEYNALI